MVEGAVIMGEGAGINNAGYFQRCMLTVIYTDCHALTDDVILRSYQRCLLTVIYTDCHALTDDVTISSDEDGTSIKNAG